METSSDLKPWLCDWSQASARKPVIPSPAMYTKSATKKMHKIHTDNTGRCTTTDWLPFPR